MKKKNNTEAPQLKVNWKHFFLVVLHLVVFVLSAFSQDFRTQVAARALPQALQLTSLTPQRASINLL